LPVTGVIDVDSVLVLIQVDGPAAIIIIFD